VFIRTCRRIRVLKPRDSKVELNGENSDEDSKSEDSWFIDAVTYSHGATYIYPLKQ
jgi:hypothetical protein